jgi:hypothetical protein
MSTISLEQKLDNLIHRIAKIEERQGRIEHSIKDLLAREGVQSQQVPLQQPKASIKTPSPMDMDADCCCIDDFWSCGDVDGATI